MSYRTLAENLQSTADNLFVHETSLNGPKLAASAEKLANALSKFDSLVRDVLRGEDPEAIALRDLLETEAVRERLDGKTAKLLLKKAAGKSLSLKKDDTPQDLRRRFLEAAIKAELAGQTLIAVRAHIERMTRPLPPPGDRDQVLAELWRLAGLDETDLAVERERLFADPALLQAMAGYAFIKLTAKSTDKSIFNALVKFARRVRENTA
jgi:hypothetical protein